MLAHSAEVVARAPVFTPLRHRHKLKEHNWRQTILSYRADDAEKLVPAEMPPGSALTIRRDAGLGDCLMIACALAALKRKRPDLHITFATPPAYTAILARFDCIDEAIPLDEALVVGAPMLEFSNYCERHPQADITNRVTIFAQALGVAAGRLPTYTPTSADMQEAQLLLRGRRPIAICMRGKYPHRSWLIPRALQFAARLADEGLDVMLFDAEEQPPYTTWISDDLPATLDVKHPPTRAFGLPCPLLPRCCCIAAPQSLRIPASYTSADAWACRSSASSARYRRTCAPPSTATMLTSSPMACLASRASKARNTSPAGWSACRR